MSNFHGNPSIALEIFQSGSSRVSSLNLTSWPDGGEESVHNRNGSSSAWMCSTNTVKAWLNQKGFLWFGSRPMFHAQAACFRIIRVSYRAVKTSSLGLTPGARAGWKAWDMRRLVCTDPHPQCCSFLHTISRVSILAISSLWPASPAEMVWLSQTKQILQSPWKQEIASLTALWPPLPHFYSSSNLIIGDGQVCCIERLLWLLFYVCEGLCTPRLSSSDEHMISHMFVWIETVVITGTGISSYSVLLESNQSRMTQLLAHSDGAAPQRSQV